MTQKAEDTSATDAAPPSSSDTHPIVTTLSRAGQSLISWVRQAPTATSFAAFILCLGLIGHVLHAQWYLNLAFIPRSPAWWSDFTASLWTPHLGICLNIALLTAVLGGLLERYYGTKRWLLSAVVSALGGTLTVHAWELIASLLSVDWMSAMIQRPTGGAGMVLIGVTAAASARMNSPWKWRIRALLCALVVVFLAFIGGTSAVLFMGATVSGLLLGILMHRRHEDESTLLRVHDPLRMTVPLSVAVVSIGTIWTLCSFHSSAPLAALRPGLSPDLAQQEEILRECGAALSDMECLRQFYQGSSEVYVPILLAAMPWVMQLVLAWGLFRGRRGALRGTVALQSFLALLGTANFMSMVFGSADSLPVDDEVLWIPVHLSQLFIPVLLPLFLVLLMIWTREAFTVRIAASTWTMWGLRTFLLAVVGAVATLILGILAPQNFFPRGTLGLLAESYAFSLLPTPLQWLFESPLYPETPAGTLILLGIPSLVWILSAVFCFVALQSPPMIAESSSARLASLVRESNAGNLGWMLTWEGNSTWISRDGKSGVSYRSDGSVALTVTDFASTRGAIDEVIAEFSAFSVAHGLVPALYSVGEETALAASRAGWVTLKVAEEAVCDLGNLAFTGKKFQDIRTAFNHANKQGIRAEWMTYPDASPQIRRQIREISDAWAREKSLPEMGFTLGGMKEIDDPETRMLVACDEDDRVHAVTSWMPVYREGTVVGLTLDMMRRKEGGFKPAIEFLIGRAALDAQDEGLEFISLSGAPLANSGLCEENPKLAMTPAVDIAPLLDAVSTMMEPMYGFRSLLAFKKKFQARFVPMYVALPDLGDGPAVSLALARAYVPHMGAREAATMITKVVFSHE